MKKINFFKWILSLVLLCSVSFVQAADIYLSSPTLGGDDANNGLTPGTAVATLRKAYDLINSAAGTIHVSGEVDGYSNPVNADAVCPFLGNSYTLTIQGVEGTNPKIVGKSSARMFRLRSDMALKLKNLILSGSPDDIAMIDGSCIRFQGGSLEADNVIFENFKSNVNGAVMQIESTLSTANPTLAFTNCIFRNNSSGTAGYGSVLRAVDNAAAGTKIYFENCAFLNNEALYGTIFIRQAAANKPEITFVNSTFTGNTNGNGNAGSITIFSANINLNIINCTVKDNPTNGSIRVTDAATVNICNSILEGNGGNDLNCETGVKTPILTVRNSLILAKRNVPDDVYLKPANYTAVGQLLNTFDTETNTFTPKFASLAIGYGDKQYLENLGTTGSKAINYDQLGHSRSFANNKVDVGAVEVGESAIWVSAAGNDANSGTNSLPVRTLKKAFSFFSANQTGTIYVSGNVVSDTEVNGLDLNGVNLSVKGVAGTNPGITGDSIRLFYLRNNSTLILKDLHLSGNPAKSLVGQGGCIHVFNGGSVIAENVIFENFSTAFNPIYESNPNGDMSGAGVIFLNQFNASSSNPILSFKNCKFRNNSTTGNWGGGVLRVQDFGSVANPKVYFENCGFYGNKSTRLGGSAVFVRGGATANSEISFINSTITASGTGGNGVIYIYGGSNITLDIINSTIKDNAVRGLFTEQTTFPVLNIYNSVLEGNAVADIYYQDKVTEPGTLNVHNSLIGSATWINVATAPYTKPTEYTVGTLFEELNVATISYKPKNGSLAINYGNAEYLTALGIDYDQLLNPREFNDNFCDAGAVETAKILSTVKHVEESAFRVWSNGDRIVINQPEAKEVFKSAIAIVYTIEGKKIASQILNREETVINQTFSTGLYLVKIGNESNKVIVR